MSYTKENTNQMRFSKFHSNDKLNYKLLLFILFINFLLKNVFNVVLQWLILYPVWIIFLLKSWTFKKSQEFYMYIYSVLVGETTCCQLR